MNINNYSSWLPLADLVGRVIVEKIEDTDDGLTIYLNLPKSKIKRRFKIVFDPYVAYRNMDESYRSKTFSENDVFEKSLNLVENSSWLEWLHSESQGYYEGVDIKHYSIVTDADFIDVLAEFPPEVNWID